MCKWISFWNILIQKFDICSLDLLYVAPMVADYCSPHYENLQAYRWILGALTESMLFDFPSNRRSHEVLIQIVYVSASPADVFGVSHVDHSEYAPYPHKKSVHSVHDE